MAAVMIGIDPHKASPTAVATGAAEEPLGRLRVRASAAQARRLVDWAAGWPERTRAAGGAGGLGHLLARQLVAAGERVPGVQPRLGARVRLLAAGDTNKNDPGDARSVAIAALRSASRREGAADDHAAVLKIWSRRHRDLGRARTQVACRLHAVLCELVPGGISKEITAAHAARVLQAATPSGEVARAHHELAALFPGDLRRLDAQLRDTRKKLETAVRASGTTTTGIFWPTPGARQQRPRRGPGRATGERLCRQRGRLTPRAPALRPSHSRIRQQPTTPHQAPPPNPARSQPERPLDNKEASICTIRP